MNPLLFKNMKKVFYLIIICFMPCMFISWTVVGDSRQYPIDVETALKRLEIIVGNWRKFWTIS